MSDDLIHNIICIFMYAPFTKTVPSIFIYIALAIMVAVPFASAATTATLLPTGEGTNLAWTPSAGSTHYTLVDEASCNGTTDYVSETTVGDRDSYTVSLATIPNGATITNIALTPCASRNSSGGGSATLNVFHRFNGTASADAGAYALPTGTTPVALATTNFAGLSHVKRSTSTLQVGAVYSAGTRGVRLSRLATVITYTPAIPQAPSNLIGTLAATTTAVTLSWNDNSSDETGFSLERSLDNVSFGVIATTSTNIRTYKDTVVTSSTTYYYKVRAFNTTGFSAFSNTATVLVP